MVLLFEHNFLPASASLLSTIIFGFIATDFVEFEFIFCRGVQVELCGATAKAHGWGNADVIPGIKINTDAMARTTQLVQEGFVKISES